MNAEVAYCFLSEIKERSSNVRSLVEIFRELVENVLAKNQTEDGINLQFKDLHDLFRSTYSFPVPIPTLKDIVKRIKKEFPSHVEIFRDSSFHIGPNLIRDRAEEIKKNEQEIQTLATVFDEYCKIKNVNIKSDELFSFIESSKKELVSFVNRQSFSERTPKDSFFLGFIKTIYPFEPLQKTFRKLIMGSVISSYFEIKADKPSQAKIFLLDTNFIVSLLDLHTEESRITAETLVDIAIRDGHSFYVLPETINETQNLLQRKAKELEKFIFLRAHNPHTIEEGCKRRNLGSRELNIFAERLFYFLQGKKIKIVSERDNDRLKAEAPNTEAYKRLSDRDHNKEGVLHDAMTINYIRNLRGNNQAASFMDNRGFILKDSNTFIDDRRTPNAVYTSSSIEAEYLLNILWLSSPIFDDIILTANISKMLSSNLDKQLPDRDMLAKIDEKIGLFANFGIDNEACFRLAENIAEAETEELTELTEISDQEQFNMRLAEIAEKSEAKARYKEEETKEILVKILHSLDSNGMVARNEIIQKMEIKIKEKEDDNQSLLKKQDIEHKKELLLRDKETRNRLEDELADLRQRIDARFNVVTVVFLCLIIFTLIFVYRLFLNPIVRGIDKYGSLLSVLFSVLILFFSILTGRKFSASDISIGIKKLCFKKKIKKADSLESEIKKIEGRIRNLENEIGEKGDMNDFYGNEEQKSLVSAIFTAVLVLIVAVASFLIPIPI